MTGRRLPLLCLPDLLDCQDALIEKFHKQDDRSGDIGLRVFPLPNRPSAVDTEQIRKLGLREPQLPPDPFELKWGQLPSLPDNRYACLRSLKDTNYSS